MGGTLDEKCTAIKAAGYEGWEDWIQPHFQIRATAEKHGLEYMGMAVGQEPDQLRRDLDEVHDSGAIGCTVHAGHAYMEFQEGLDLLGKLVEIGKTYPFPVNFETHRSRLLFEPVSCARYLTALPDLWVVADLSHWAVVTESLLGHYRDHLDLTISRARHIHARVGHEEGPQVPDPRVAQWTRHVEAFHSIWDRIKAAHEARNAEVFTIDPEYGPANYMWTNPADGKELASVEDVSLWQREALKKRWAAK